MKTLTAALLASAFIASPALACGFGKTAGHKMDTVAAVKVEEKTDEAMTTFDPAKAPLFEDVAEAKEEVADEEKKLIAE